MAQASSSPIKPKSLTERPVGDEGLRRSASTTRRNSHYDQQRRSYPRPATSSSQRPSTSRSKGKRASYQEPQDWDNLNENVVPPPARDDQPDSLEKNASRQADSTGKGQRDQELSETAAPPPVQTSEAQSSTATTAAGRSHPDAAERGDADSESSAAPPPFAQRRPEEYLRQKKVPPPASRPLTELYTLSYLIFFSILGTLARLGVQWLTFYPGAPVVTPVIWANFGGSFFMGFLAEDQGLFRDSTADFSPKTEKQQDIEQLTKAERAKRKKAIPLYIGLATGFCGSFTSFSSFARDAFLGLSNNLPTPLNHPNDFSTGTPSATSTVSRNGGYSFEAWIAVVITTLALSLGGLLFGGHTALLMDPVMPRIPVSLARRFLDPFAVVLGWGCWLGAVFLAIWPPDRPAGPSSRGSWAQETWRGEVLFAIVFAPIGCLLRFYASIKLNGLVPAFPLGTFAVNMLGTAVEGMCYDIQHVGVGIMGRTGGGRTGCQVLQGVMDGFSGCLTTVSTWVAEINGLRRRHGYTYAFASVVGALCLMVVIMGSVKWSVGFSTPVCNTGYPNKIYG